jgi:Putative beta-lactamase-inhibitor-like, PepSY-like
MNTRINIERGIYLVMGAALGLSSCKKELSTVGTDTSTASTIAVAASSSVSGTTTDSIYILQPCARGSQRDSIAESSLLPAITTYLTNNYSGYTFLKAFSIVNSSGTITGYAVIVYFNNKPVGIEFDSNGNFVKVLEQREKGDLDGRGWHHGGRFEDRDGLQKDSIALTALPTAVQSYMSSNFSTDTLLKAYKNRDSGYVVLSKNSGLFATVFDANGNFIKRVQLPSGLGNVQGITQSSLPATALSYLDSTYPNYVFKKAFVLLDNGVPKGYVAFIDANNTKYAVEFDASGNFVNAKTVC